MRVQVADMKRYDDFYKRLVNSVPGLSDVTSSCHGTDKIHHYLLNNFVKYLQEKPRAIICPTKLVLSSGVATLPRRSACLLSLPFCN
jgi:hypothetical protein